MGCDDPILLYGCMSCDAWVHAICVLSFNVDHVLLMSNCVKGLLSFKVHLSIHAEVCNTWSNPKSSLTTDIIYISVCPGFWKWIPMICMQELIMTASAAYIDSPSM